ncbi:MAG: DUF2867 domain-containing protein [Caulobacteraceae bacterium]|nr:DUF2867 domain-containing protein [Caulobacteraceae bacterium]
MTSISISASRCFEDDRAEGSARVVLSTGVMTHNAFGRAYLATILRFHRFGVTQLLTNASRGERV